MELLNALLYINIVLVCLHALVRSGRKKWCESRFTFKVNSDLLWCVFLTILENLQRLDLS